VCQAGYFQECLISRVATSVRITGQLHLARRVRTRRAAPALTVNLHGFALHYAHRPHFSLHSFFTVPATSFLLRPFVFSSAFFPYTLLSLSRNQPSTPYPIRTNFGARDISVHVCIQTEPDAKVPYQELG